MCARWMWWCTVCGCTGCDHPQCVANFLYSCFLYRCLHFLKGYLVGEHLIVFRSFTLATAICLRYCAPCFDVAAALTGHKPDPLLVSLVNHPCLQHSPQQHRGRTECVWHLLVHTACVWVILVHSECVWLLLVHTAPLWPGHP